MCRGCDMKISGESSTYEYLDWLDKHGSISAQMKALEKEYLYLPGN